MKSTIIGVSGGSGSGKSVFIRDLKQSFSKDQVCFISLDNYYRKREDQKEDRNGIKNFDLPTSVDLDSFTADLKKLQEGKTVVLEEYTFNNPLAESQKIILQPAPVIIAEGLFIFYHKPSWDLLDLSIFIYASDSQRLSRRIIRDQMERNYPLEDVLYRYEHHVYPAYKAFIEPFFDRVDVIINNTSNYKAGINIVRGFLSQAILENLPKDY